MIGLLIIAIEKYGEDMFQTTTFRPRMGIINGMGNHNHVWYDKPVTMVQLHSCVPLTSLYLLYI